MWQRNHPGNSILVSVILVGFIVWFLRYAELESRTVDFLNTVENAGSPGQFLFIAIVAVSVMLLVPSTRFTLGAGYLFGIVHGSVLIVLAEVLGATTAFVLARYCFGDRAATFIRTRKSLARISVVMVHEGWRVIALLCMVPLFPFKLGCNLYGLSPVRLSVFVQGTFIGLWPLTLFNVYLGSLFADLVSIGTASSEITGGQWVMYGIGLLMFVCVLVFIVKKAQHQIHELEQNIDGRVQSIRV